MEYTNAVILAVIEGITEFLPISSTGHLILAERLLRLDEANDFARSFIVIIQLPAILSVVLYFWRDLWPLGKPPEAVRATLRLWSTILVAVIPAVVLGLLFSDAIEAMLDRPLPVVAALILGGVVLVLVEQRHPVVRTEDAHTLGYGRAFAIGLFQCIAMIPGVSRSAATIVGAMLLGASRPVAAEFSFYLAIPTMLGATILTLLKGGIDFTHTQWMTLAIGSLVSFLTAYGAVAFLMRYIQTHDFRIFGYYRIVLGLILLLWYMA